MERDIKFFSKTKGAGRRVVDSFYGEAERERGSTTKSDNAMGQRRILRAGAGRINWLSSHSYVFLLHINPVAKLSWPEASIFVELGNAIINIVFASEFRFQSVPR